jgi:hypothetical protein
MLPGLFVEMIKEKTAQIYDFYYLSLLVSRAKIIKIDWTKLASALESF